MNQSHIDQIVEKMIDKKIGLSVYWDVSYFNEGRSNRRIAREAAELGLLKQVEGEYQINYDKVDRFVKLTEKSEPPRFNIDMVTNEFKQKFPSFNWWRELSVSHKRYIYENLNKYKFFMVIDDQQIFLQPGEDLRNRHKGRGETLFVTYDGIKDDFELWFRLLQASNLYNVVRTSKILTDEQLADFTGFPEDLKRIPKRMEDLEESIKTKEKEITALRNCISHFKTIQKNIPDQTAFDKLQEKLRNEIKENFENEKANRDAKVSIA